MNDTPLTFVVKLNQFLNIYYYFSNMLKLLSSAIIYKSGTFPTLKNNADIRRELTMLTNNIETITF